MKKLQLDALKVDTFATTNGIDAIRGTVAAHSAQCTFIDCPESHRDTCEITCQSCDSYVPCS